MLSELLKHGVLYKYYSLFLYNTLEIMLVGTI